MAQQVQPGAVQQPGSGEPGLGVRDGVRLHVKTMNPATWPHQLAQQLTILPGVQGCVHRHVARAQGILEGAVGQLHSRA